MENINDQTIKTYQDNFHKYSERTPSEVTGEFKVWMDSFCSLLPEQGKIFELGSASGRDAQYFKSKGFEVFCTDVVHEALNSLAEKGFETAAFDFRNKPDNSWLDGFDGLFANAVLLHAPQEVFEESVKNISKIVKENGIIAFSLKTGEGDEISLEKMDAPRYFKYHSKQQLEKTLSNFNFEIISIIHADNEKWLHVLLKNK